MAYYGFSYNAVTGATMGLTLQGWRYSLLPPASPQYTQLGYSDGALFQRNPLGRREIVLETFYVATTYTGMATTERALAAYLRFDTPKQLILLEETTKYYNCIVTDIRSEVNWPMVSHAITFTCYDPYAYETTTSTDTVTAGAASKVITNSGTAICPVKVDWTETSSTAKNYSLAIGGKTVSMSYTSTSSAVMSLDTAYGTFTKNGTAYMSGLAVTSQWILLPVGANTLTVGGTMPALTLTWRKRYL
jgi:predicted phage tail component-like protein